MAGRQDMSCGSSASQAKPSMHNLFFSLPPHLAPILKYLTSTLSQYNSTTALTHCLLLLQLASSMEIPTNPAIAANLHKLLGHWQASRGVDAYYGIPLRAPYKGQVVSSELNRFGGGMGPYVDSFVNDVPDVPYINATPLTFEETPADENEFKYIATMCPKTNTFSHFWQMVWFKNTRVVVNLTHEEDRIGSERSDKRERYWPPYSTAPSKAELEQWPLTVTTLTTSIGDTIPGLFVYDIKLVQKSSGEQRIIKLFWYSAWEDFGDSSSIFDESFQRNTMNVLLLANEVDAAQRSCSTTAPSSTASSSSSSTASSSSSTASSSASSSASPSSSDSWVGVHCSAGVGNSESLCSISNIWSVFFLRR